MSVYGQKLLFEEGVSAVTATPTCDVGTYRWEGGREYVYAYNGGSAAAIGAPVILTGTTGHTFVVTFATGADKGCTLLGVVRNVAIPAASYGWVCTRGFVDVKAPTSAAVVAADLLIVGDGGGTTRVATYTSSLTQLVAQGSVGRALSTQTAAADGYVTVFLKR